MVEFVEGQLGACFDAEVQRTAQESVGHFVAGAVAAIVDSYALELSGQEQQLGDLITQHAIATLLQEPSLVGEIEVAISALATQPETSRQHSKS